jgi:hypothetical protein
MSATGEHRPGGKKDTTKPRNARNREAINALRREYNTRNREKN